MASTMLTMACYLFLIKVPVWGETEIALIGIIIFGLRLLSYYGHYLLILEYTLSF